MSSPRDRLIGLLEYIEEQAKEIDPKSYCISSVNAFVRRPTDLAGLPGVEFDLRSEGDHIWLRVMRLEARQPPPVPDVLKGVLTAYHDPIGFNPSVDEALLNAWKDDPSWISDDRDTNEEGQALSREQQRQDANRALSEYLPRWHTWAADERPRRNSISLYGDLFALKHQIEAEETAKPQELVWGIGVASWLLPLQDGKFGFEYPLLTQAVEISIDEKTMALEIRPRATDTRVEMGAFIACSIPGVLDVDNAIREHLLRHKDQPVTPFDGSSFSDALKLAATNLDSNGLYREILEKGEPVPSSGPELVVTDSWTLLSRRRTTHFLIEDLKRLKHMLESGCPIPDGLLALVSPPSEMAVEHAIIPFRGLSSRGTDHGQSEELYFPLPYNEEQVNIIQRLERAAGVAVQGPPGTGKTHTIANVICHFLATGRRVLVTSRGETALAVLQSKIPESIRSLTVALMASDRESVRQFQAAIEAIQHQVSQLNTEQTRRDIVALEEAIDRTHQALASIDERIDAIATAQLSEVEIDGEPVRAQKLAELVKAGTDRHGWFDDDVSLSKQNEPPLTDDEAETLRTIRRNLGRDLMYVLANLPSPDRLPTTGEITELHEVLASMRTIEAEIERGALLELKATTSEVLNAARILLKHIEGSMALIEELESLDERWPLELRKKCQLPAFASEREALESLFADLDALIEARAELLKRPVEFPENGLQNRRTREAVARAADTGKPFSFLPFGNEDAKEYIAAVKISGLAPVSRDDWAHVLRYLALHDQVTSFVSRWNQFADDLSMPSLEGGIVSLKRIERVAILAKKAHQLATEYDSVLPGQAEEVFTAPPAKALWGDFAELAKLKAHLLRHLTKANLSKAATWLSTLQETLAASSGPAAMALRQFVELKLGDREIPSERAASHYAGLVAEIARIASLQADFRLIKDYAARIEQAGAPRLASRVCSQPVEESGDDGVFPPSWREAWNWARIRTYLIQIDAREEFLALSGRRRDLEDGLSRLYSDMIAKAAWLATKRNATPKVLQALAGYATAIRRIGQGKGPNATRYRKDAREAMLDAAGAIPCWIMSHARISESMPPEIGAFDLVIVDEASQSDLWALPAILRGKKILVVGDDKQVSPDAGFIASRRIEELKVRFLGDQPYGTEMTPEKSLYDLASRVFAADRVMLREHFRCVPPIIAYSNHVFYKGGIQPLRIPKASERIDPPLVDIYVKGGKRDKNNLNAYEAQVVADEISSILDDQAMAGRTIGVVSLLGMDQAKYIDSVVRQRCDAAELLHRKFECGDARTFQGSERDIIFLTMVVDSENCKAVSGNLFEQRFNVAASRARDRMYLVRSVEAADLSDKDLRQTLLNHFRNPMVTDKEQADTLIDRCESGFERDFFSVLSGLGYRVFPQVKTGAYRIDMVIEGKEDNRLAIELDGDEYHAPNQWPYDMNRQRVLERAGWAFWRCFASTWTQHKEEVLSDLVIRLEAMGIEPLGAIAQAPNLVEKREWQPAGDKAQLKEFSQFPT